MNMDAGEETKVFKRGFLSSLNRSFRLSGGSRSSFLSKSRSTEMDAGMQWSSNSKPLEMVAPRIDSYRFSMANLEDSQDADLDAILGELSALRNDFDAELSSTVSSDYSSSCKSEESQVSSASSCPSNKVCHDAPRTESPDNDSAFSDTVSMLSGESSASSGNSAKCKNAIKLNLAQNQKDQQKADKIRLALERMKEASVKKLFIKAFSMDGSTKSLLVDEKMTCGFVTRLLADKNHVVMEPRWAIVEHLPDLYMERVYEDHEMLVDNLMLWTRESKNRIIFSERPDKISLFQQPEKYLFGENEQVNVERDDHTRQMMLEEFFGPSNGTVTAIVPSMSGNRVPPIEGPLYLKSDTKKGWKRYHFVLRPSGLYYYPKEKSKSIQELVCLATFDNNEVYVGLNWRKKYKSPTDFCFAIKHPRLQQPKSLKFIKFLCADDEQTLERWIVAMRIAKHGRRLLENYRSLVDELTQEDLDHLASARACSLTSIPLRQTSLNASSPNTQSINNNIATSENGSSGRHSRASSSSSSGCMSDGGTASESAFDCEFPMGTIKRKPSMKPILPLTSMTRQLKEMAEKEEVGSEERCNASSEEDGTLTRRQVRRSTGDGTLKKQVRGSSDITLTNGTSLTNGSSLRTPSPLYGHCKQTEFTNNTYGYATVFPAVDDLPPPPEDHDMTDGATYASCYNNLENLVSSCLSLDSLPPPPPQTEDLCGSQLSLPPPPENIEPPTDVIDVPEMRELRPSFTRKPSIDSFTSSHSSEKGSLKSCTRPSALYGTLKNTLNKDEDRKTATKKRVNFADEIRCSSPRKPPPPKRNETTRLTSPKKLAESASNPPDDFLKDLQRVMRKKWQVAQKCKLEPSRSPHEVLGFREYPLGEDYREASVSMWVQEHYGTPSRKRPPPVPPPRALTTHLTATAHHNNIYNY